MPAVHTLLALTEASGERFRSEDDGYYFFLLEDGVAVSAVKIYEEEEGPYLGSIETRFGHRHRGHASLLLSLVAEEYGVKRVLHSGGFTEDGFRYLRHLVDRPDAFGPPRVAFPKYGPDAPFRLIAEWDTCSLFID